MTTRILQPLPRRTQAHLTRVVPTAVQPRLGRGLAWPPVLRDNLWEMSEGEQKIRESIFIILSTPLGSRYMQPDFGSLLPLLVFTTYNAAAEAEIKRYTYEALERWEPRVQLAGVALRFEQPAEAALSLWGALAGVSQQEFALEYPLTLENEQLRFTPPSRYQLFGKGVFSL